MVRYDVQYNRQSVNRPVKKQLANQAADSLTRQADSQPINPPTQHPVFPPANQPLALEEEEVAWGEGRN